MQRYPVRLGKRVDNRFYEPIVLFLALSTACEQQRPARAPDSSPDVIQSPESLFHNFVNKISQICDSEKYGTTVTSFVVLKCAGDHPIEYRFASNQRSGTQLEESKTFITLVLNTVRQSKKDSPGHSSRTDVLRQILLYNKERVSAYLTSMGEHCESCISGVGRSEKGTYVH